jgi:hypothetical protein
VQPAGELVDVGDERKAQAGEDAERRRGEELSPQALEAEGGGLGVGGRGGALGRRRPAAQAAASPAAFSSSGYSSKSRIQWLVFLYCSMRRLPIVGYHA